MEMITKARDQEARQIDLAATLAAKVEIEDVLLEEATLKRGRNSKNILSKVQISSKVEASLNDEKTLITVRPRLSVETAPQSDGPEGFRIEAQFVLTYRVAALNDVTQANIDAFGNLNGIYNVWPFWREFVQSTTARMGLPSLTLPVFRPVKPARKPKIAAR